MNRCVRKSVILREDFPDKEIIESIRINSPVLYFKRDCLRNYDYRGPWYVNKFLDNGWIGKNTMNSFSISDRLIILKRRSRSFAFAREVTVLVDYPVLIKLFICLAITVLIPLFYFFLFSFSFYNFELLSFLAKSYIRLLWFNSNRCRKSIWFRVRYRWFLLFWICNGGTTFLLNDAANTLKILFLTRMSISRA